MGITRNAFDHFQTISITDISSQYSQSSCKHKPNYFLQWLTVSKITRKVTNEIFRRQGTDDSILVMLWINVLTHNIWENQLLGRGLCSPNAFIVIIFVSRLLLFFFFFALANGNILPFNHRFLDLLSWIVEADHGTPVSVVSHELFPFPLADILHSLLDNSALRKVSHLLNVFHPSISVYQPKAQIAA